MISKTSDRPVEEVSNLSNLFIWTIFTDGLHQRNSLIPCHLDSHPSRNVRICGELPRIPTR